MTIEQVDNLRVGDRVKHRYLDLGVGTVKTVEYHGWMIWWEKGGYRWTDYSALRTHIGLYFGE